MSLASGARTAPPIVSVIALCIGGMATAFTQTLVIPLQTELPRLLGTSASNSAWVVTVTLLAASVFMVVAGRLADLFGKQRVLMASAGALIVGSLVCALSSSLTPMLVGRALQGMSIGFIPVGISLIREITPPRMAPTALAAMSATLGVGGAIGLPLAAWIVDVGGWHTVFWVSTAVAAVVFVLAAVAIPHIHDGHEGRFDVLGALGLAVGLVVFLVGISKATAWGWGDARTLGAIAGGLAVLVLWVFVELRQDEPLVDLRATAKRPVLMTNIAALAVGFGMMAQSIVIPQLLQLPAATGYGLGQSLQATGLWMAPAGLMMLAFAPISSRLIRSTGPRITLVIGALVLAVGYSLGVVLMDAPWQLLIVMCVGSAGVGIGYAAMPTLILDATPPQDAAAAVGLNALTRSVGGSVAAALMGTVLASNTTAFEGIRLPGEGAFTLCFGIGAIAALAGAVIAAFLPRRRRSTTATVTAVPAAPATEADVVTAV
ncbi:MULTISPECIES: MFS transporter [Parafrankia]|nr:MULTISPECIES: MFS transporter [Parafrankia]MBE3202445.1 MFS transporter [Parafrankia sp. CH37]